MCFSQWTKGSSGQSIQTRILLANSNQRRILSSTTLRWLPTLSHTLKQTRGLNYTNFPNMAPPAMGNGSRWPAPNSTRKHPIRGGCSRILHQMDQGNAFSYDNLADHQKVLLAKNPMPLWSTKRANQGQRNLV